MKIQYVLSLFIGIAYSNDYGVLGTGLELDRIDDYIVDISLHNTKNIDFEYNEHELENYVMKLLYEGNLPQTKNISNNRLLVHIEFGSYVGNGGFETRIWLTFHRDGTYVASNRKYKKLSQVWKTETSYIFSNPTHTKFNTHIIKVVGEHLGKFSKSLHNSNK